MKKTIHLVAAARPNFIKIAPLYHRMKTEGWIEPKIIHTGQHYDINMSDAFFDDLKLPEPYLHLGVGSGTHAEQTGKVLMAYENVLFKERPSLLIVVGDVNSTMAATLAASKLGVPVAHLEAGLRSFDRGMPEEINRIVTDHLADILWTPSPDADENLLREGIIADRIVRVGNIMIDSLEMLKDRIEREATFKKHALATGAYGVVTLHRPSNVDNPEKLNTIFSALIRASEKIPLIFPVHPRTMKNLKSNGLFRKLSDVSNLILTDPMSYIPFMNLVFNCKLVITDSGGLQEESTYLGIPCLTLRPNTERPITIAQGTNKICKLEELEQDIDSALAADGSAYRVPDLWDGKTSVRVLQSIAQRI